LRFKKEIVLLAVALVLFVSSSILYSYPADNQNQVPYAYGLGDSASVTSLFSYQTLALSAIGFGLILMVIAAISYKKSSKH